MCDIVSLKAMHINTCTHHFHTSSVSSSLESFIGLLFWQNVNEFLSMPFYVGEN